jgi:hypothetical protein
MRSTTMRNAVMENESVVPKRMSPLKGVGPVGGDAGRSVMLAGGLQPADG